MEPDLLVSLTPLIGSAVIAAVVTILGNWLMAVRRHNFDVDVEKSNASIKHQEWLRSEVLETFRPFSSFFPAFMVSFHYFATLDNRVNNEEKSETLYDELDEAHRRLVDMFNLLTVLIKKSHPASKSSYEIMSTIDDIMNIAVDLRSADASIPTGRTQQLQEDAGKIAGVLARDISQFINDEPKINIPKLKWLGFKRIAINAN